MVVIDGIEFKCCDLYDFFKESNYKVDFMIFKGIYYYLLDLIYGFCIVVDVMKDVLWLNMVFIFCEDYIGMVVEIEGDVEVMLGVYGFFWYLIYLVVMEK